MNIYKYIIKGGLAQMYKSRRTIFVFLLALVLILGVLPEFHVRAEDNSQTYKVGADDHTLWDRVQDGVFQYAAGSMEIEGAGLQGDAAQADVAAGTEITITLTPGKDCVLRSFMVNGQSIAVASMTTNGASYIYKTKVENADLKFEPSFEASGGNASGPNPGTGNNICFRLEGDGISPNDYATWKNNNIEIYIGIENTYKTLQEWIGENKISVDGTEYRVDDSVDTVKVYVLNSGSGKYMIQGAGSSQENAVTWTEKGIHSIQVDKERITITWGYDSKTYGEDAYLEHGTARIIQINGTAPNTNDPYGNNVGDNRGGNLVVQPGATVTVELNLNQIVAKGDGTNWETKITEFTNPITLSLGINNYDANYDYVVVRDHNGTTTALPTKVIDGKVTFETNQFSTYVIVKKEKTTAGTSTGGSSHEDTKGNDNNSSDAQPAATQAVTQELDVVPKTGEGIATYITEIMLLFGGILLITMGILLQRKRG